MAAGRQSYPHPLRLVERVEQRRPESALRYRLRRSGPGDWRLEWRAAGDAWAPHYAIDPGPYVLADFAGRCAFHQSSPDSTFTQGLLCTRLLADGRVTIAGERLIRTRHGERTEQALEGAAAVRAALRTWCGIELDDLP